MDVRARGVKRGGLVCSDELAGHRERYSLSSFPDTAIQFCLLHTLRTLMNLVRAIARHGRQQEGREAMRRERNRKHAPRHCGRYVPLTALPIHMTMERAGVTRFSQRGDRAIPRLRKNWRQNDYGGTSRIFVTRHQRVACPLPRTG